MPSEKQTLPLVIRRARLRELTGFHPSTVDRLERAGLWPARRRLAPGCVGWLTSEVEAYLRGREKVPGGSHEGEN